MAWPFADRRPTGTLGKCWRCGGIFDRRLGGTEDTCGECSMVTRGA